MKIRKILIYSLIVTVLLHSVPMNVYASMHDSAKKASEKAKSSEEEKEEKTTVSNSGCFSGPHFQQWGGDIHHKGCTVLSLQHIIQNSGVLQGDNTKYQLSSNKNYVNSSDKFDGDSVKYGDWDTYCGSLGGFQSGLNDGMIQGNFPVAVDKMSGGKYSATQGGEATNLTASDAKVFYKLGDKTFQKMTYDEVKEAFKIVYEAGYWCAVGVFYKGQHETNQSSLGTLSCNHFVCFSGFDSNGDVMLYDSGVGYYVDANNGNYNTSLKGMMNGEWDKTYEVSCIMPFKIEGLDMKDALGGVSQKADTKVAENLGVDTSVAIKNGYYNENELAAYMKLTEMNIQLDLLDEATLNNLTGDEAGSIDNWKENVGERKKNFNWFIRVGIQVLGILLTLWGILFYLAYWLDRLNNFVELDFVSILTMNKMQISGDESESTFKLTDIKSKEKILINHTNAITISVIAIAFGSLLLTGLIYNFVFWIVRQIAKVIGLAVR